MVAKLRAGIAHADIVTAVNALIDGLDEFQDVLDDLREKVEEKVVAKKAPAKKVAPPAE
ncbi:hypothetical protein [Mycobacteroides chelonae]|uniref:hypothetical protein n=1 Tax=Mycobacteroides chelonae TaxID=1774 RepID=UPI0013F4D780|nr:hypothetical protein [Mycobacteroides chelonae]